MECYLAPDSWRTDLPTVFLAGGITDTADWRAAVVAMLAESPIALLNPRRADFPMADPTAAEEQIRWEFSALTAADVILFWFPAGPSPQPIALYELGRYVALDKVVVVGRDPAYSRAQDVDLQMSLARPGRRVHADLRAVVDEVEALITG